ncbi:hypothetical protein B0T18DRAFT_66073 [Schizothecium vesticola]|uniref:Uncharacterized protein n=1 Tax=Schizothecium vesticola TaxID=314040 RepID=A0AA40F599_9PEZI|nr:hypothetical protein B0T18DRAFT_66073 [Schizothecium vesticola]
MDRRRDCAGVLWSRTPRIAPDATPPGTSTLDLAPRRVKASENQGSCSSCVRRPGTRRGRRCGNTRANGSLSSRISLGKEALRKTDPARTLAFSVQSAPQLQRRRRDEWQRLGSVGSSSSSCVCLCCGTLAQGWSRPSQRRQRPAGRGPGPRFPATTNKLCEVNLGVQVASPMGEQLSTRSMEEHDRRHDDRSSPCGHRSIGPSGTLSALERIRALNGCFLSAREAFLQRTPRRGQSGEDCWISAKPRSLTTIDWPYQTRRPR